MGAESKKRELFGLMLEYLEAITTNDASRLPLSPKVKVTNNGVVSEAASSCIWGHPRRIPFRQTFVDTETDNAVFFGVVTNSTTEHVGDAANWWFYVVRIKSENGAITEIEEIIREQIFAHYEKMPWELKRNNTFSIILPEDEQVSRSELINTVEAYWNAVERSIDGFSLPVHPDAVRYECGTVTTDAKNFPNSVRGDFIKTQNKGWRWDVVNRRYPVVDVQRGVVVSFADLKMTDLTNPKFLPCIVAEAFKIECGLIKELNAFFYSGENSSDW